MYFSASRLGFFDQSLGSDFVEVSKDDHNRIMKKLSEGYTLGADEDGNPIAIAPPEVPEPSLEDLFKERLASLNADYEQAGSLIRGTYPITETSTWPVQLSEAKLYDVWRKAGKTGTAPETPFLTDLTTRRTAYSVGTGLEDLVDRILTNDALYSPAIAEVTAARHAAEQALGVAYAAEDTAALKAVTWNLVQNLASSS